MDERLGAWRFVGGNDAPFLRHEICVPIPQCERGDGVCVSLCMDNRSPPARSARSSRQSPLARMRAGTA